MPHEEAVRDLLLERSQVIDVTDVTGSPWIEIDFPDRCRARGARCAAATAAACQDRHYMNASNANPARPRCRARPSPAAPAAADAARATQLEFLMEAHNGLSARIVREAGFKGIWASGLAISAQFGVRDNNEASWTQVVDMLEFMADASDLPILLDGDTGYGNFNNMRRLVRKLEQRGIAGVCIEDKQFPKTNSFLNGERQPLADIDEFCRQDRGRQGHADTTRISRSSRAWRR